MKPFHVVITVTIAMHTLHTYIYIYNLPGSGVTHGERRSSQRRGGGGSAPAGPAAIRAVIGHRADNAKYGLSNRRLILILLFNV